MDVVLIAGFGGVAPNGELPFRRLTCTSGRWSLLPLLLPLNPVQTMPLSAITIDNIDVHSQIKAPAHEPAMKSIGTIMDLAADTVCTCFGAA
jgi:hypothetical protein